jgi:hypothetical protein
MTALVTDAAGKPDDSNGMGMHKLDTHMESFVLRQRSLARADRGSTPDDQAQPGNEVEFIVSAGKYNSQRISKPSLSTQDHRSCTPINKGYPRRLLRDEPPGGVGVRATLLAYLEVAGMYLHDTHMFLHAQGIEALNKMK